MSLFKDIVLKGIESKNTPKTILANLADALDGSRIHWRVLTRVCNQLDSVEMRLNKLENPPPQTPTQANPFETEEDCEAELEDPSPAKPSDKPIPPKPNIWCCTHRPFDFTPSDNKWVCTGCKRKFLSRSV